jgi:fatty acid desaturase
MVVGQRARQQVAAAVLPKEEWSKYNENSSDVQAFLQVAFHAGCALAAAFLVHTSRECGSISGLIGGEIALGFVSSFYFMGFHEMIHNTAFRTKWLNKLSAKIVGFFIFRGADWFWCFHWLHHRYTQDPEKDPELSGGSSDLADPSRGILMYLRFLTGWPFGFERIFKMFEMAAGKRVDPWTAESGMEKEVRREAIVYSLLYATCAVWAILDEQARMVMFLYWILPHMLGAGHLRFYQFAEHRACEGGTYTELDAWGSTRTTATWWIYCKLAWYMPYHVEHHAWPAVPFHLLPEVHERIKATQPKSRCLISGNNGYTGIHLEFLRRLFGNEPTSLDFNVVDKEGKAEANGDLNNFFSVEGLPKFTMAEVGSHATRNDCWVVVDGKVLNITSFLAEHPGGEQVILNKAGKDVSKIFKMIHPEGTLEARLPKECLLGALAGEDGAAPKPATNGGLAAPLLQK